MKFNCENCGTRYTLSDEKVKNRILKIRCKVCEDVIIVRDPAHAVSRPPSLAPAPAPEVEWYVSRDGGTPEGPMPLERLVDRITSGQLKSADMVWNQSMTDWARAEEALDAQFKAGRATVPRPPIPNLPRPSGRVREPAPLLPRSAGRVAQPGAPKPLAPKLPAPKPPAPKPPAPKLPAPKLPAPKLPVSVVEEPSVLEEPAVAAPAEPLAGVPVLADDLLESEPPQPIASSAPPAEPLVTEDDVDEPTQAMATDLGGLFASLATDQDAEPDAEQGHDTVALPASDAQADTLFAPAATASAAGAMQTRDTTSRPGIDAAPGPPSVTDWESLGGVEGTPDDDARLSVAGPALPSSEPPPAVPEPEDSKPPAAVDAPAAPKTMTGGQFALAEDAFFGTEERAAAAAAPDASASNGPASTSDASASMVSARARAVDGGAARRSMLPLLIVLGVLLVGGGIALGLMLADGKGGVAPATTASNGAAAALGTEAPTTISGSSEAPASEAPASAPPTDAPPSTPVSEAPITAASVASAAPVTKRAKRPASVASRAKRNTVKTEAPASKAPATSTGRFASLGGKKPKDVPVAALATEALIELPETLSPGKISSTIRRYKKGLHGCYQRQLKRDASMRKANLKLGFNIERSGRTSNIKIDRKYDGTELKTCLNRLVRRWRFPQFTGESIPVEYPLFFQASL
ncbi:MAG: putative Zn finger-like uncharacterized protein [Bradymonadia bacterium]|jgi:predicted Zn finger-like uncharacterized protein